MTAIRCAGVRSALLLSWAFLIFPGCHSQPAAKSVPATGSGYTAKTSGSPGELLAHLERLNRRFARSKQEDLSGYRRNLLAYTTAAETTADALLAAEGAGPELRRKAAEAKLDALFRRAEVEPAAFDRLVAAADRLEAEPPESGLAPIAAYNRIQAIFEVAGSTDPDVIEDRWFDRLAEAAVRLGRATPPHPEAPWIVMTVASAAERRGQESRARELYTLVTERFPDAGIVKYAAGSLRRLALKGKDLGEFSGKGFDGETVDLKTYRGKVVLIDFWATWCVPCLNEMPKLKELRERLGPKGFEILGVCLDDTPDRPRMLLTRGRIEWPQVYFTLAPEKPEPNPLAVRFGVSEIPFFLVVDREGRFVATGNSLEKLAPLVEAQFAPANRSPGG